MESAGEEVAELDHLEGQLQTLMDKFKHKRRDLKMLKDDTKVEHNVSVCLYPVCLCFLCLYCHLCCYAFISTGPLTNTDHVIYSYWPQY